MAIYTIQDTTLTSIADAIREKTGKTDLITPEDMGTAITNLPSGGDLPEEAFLITGDCLYRFANGGWDWFIREYGNRITTKDIENMDYMFYFATALEQIPFELNCKSGPLSGHNMTSMFTGCHELKSLPKINNAKPSVMNSLLYGCNHIRNIPDDYFDAWDFSYIEGLTSGYSGNSNSLFQYCHSLRSFPYKILEHVNKNANNSYTYFYNGFYECYALDELVDLPIPYTAAWTASAFYNTFNSCSRLKNITFVMPDGQPYAMNWKSQIIDLSTNVGWVRDSYLVLNYNSGITKDKRVTDDATYQTLKNDPDWFTTDMTYSRYNHDSAVATINSLPDTSAYLATSGGTNTIKFTGSSGRATDGGAIDTLTEAEIAVAAAKGWTVTLV